MVQTAVADIEVRQKVVGHLRAKQVNPENEVQEEEREE